MSRETLGWQVAILAMKVARCFRTVPRRFQDDSMPLSSGSKTAFDTHVKRVEFELLVVEGRIERNAGAAGGDAGIGRVAPPKRWQTPLKTPQECFEWFQGGLTTASWKHTV